MENNSKVRNIEIGEIIISVIHEKGFTVEGIRMKMGVSIKAFKNMIQSERIDTLDLMKLSKALKYDFFRLYSSHLMLHHGISNTLSQKTEKIKIEGIHIRKNVYTKDLILFVVSKVRKKEMTTKQVIEKFGIPKTTFYKWLQKYPNE